MTDLGQIRQLVEETEPDHMDIGATKEFLIGLGSRTYFARPALGRLLTEVERLRDGASHEFKGKLYSRRQLEEENQKQAAAIKVLRSALEFIRDNTNETLANNVSFKALKQTEELL